MPNKVGQKVFFHTGNQKTNTKSCFKLFEIHTYFWSHFQTSVLNLLFKMYMIQFCFFVTYLCNMQEQLHLNSKVAQTSTLEDCPQLLHEQRNCTCLSWTRSCGSWGTNPVELSLVTHKNSINFGVISPYPLKSCPKQSGGN